MSSTEDALPPLLEFLSCDRLPSSCKSDQYMSETAIVDAYQTFRADIRAVLDAASTARSLLPIVISSTFEHAFISFSHPYREALHRMEVAKESVRATSSEKLLEVTQDITTTLYEKLDKAPITQISVPGSVSRRETWEKVKQLSGTVMNSALPECPDRSITDTAIAPLVRRKFSGEPAMYEPVTRTKVLDTHARYFLDGQAPDITISMQDVVAVDCASVVAIIDLKSPSMTPMDSDSFGQVYGYLRKLSHAQPNRTRIVGLLSNLTFNHIIIHNTPSQGVVNIVHFASSGFARALRYLKYTILHDPSTLPSIPSFSPDLGRLERRLGNTALSVIGVFSYPEVLDSPNLWIAPNPPAVGTKFVVKRTSYGPPRRHQRTITQTLSAVRTPNPRSVDLPSQRPVATEIEILKSIRQSSRCPPPNLPQLVYHPLDMNEFGIKPLGLSIDLHTVSQDRGRTILREVLGSLEWLHKEAIIHRDVRWDNIVWVVTHSVLIDFGSSIVENDSYCSYEGGIVCAPPRVVHDFQRQYRASPADDCMAWVLLMHALLSPTRWAAMMSERITVKGSRERARLQNLWATLVGSSVWGPGVRAADQQQYEGMLELLDLVVLL